jgi:hypothetical protein
MYFVTDACFTLRDLILSFYNPLNMTLYNMCVLTPLVELLDAKEDPLGPEPDLASRFRHDHIDHCEKIRRGPRGSLWWSNAIQKG